MSAWQQQFRQLFDLSFDDDEGLKARKENFAAYHAVMLDDVGTKVPGERLDDIEPTWRIETSPGNYQVGIALTEPLSDAAKATELQQAIIEAGLCDPGAGGLTRWSSPSGGINGKLSIAMTTASRFVVAWTSGILKSATRLEATACLSESQARPRQESPSMRRQAIPAVIDPETVLLPKPEENLVIKALKGPACTRRHRVPASTTSPVPGERAYRWRGQRHGVF